FTPAPPTGLAPLPLHAALPISAGGRAGVDRADHPVHASGLERFPPSLDRRTRQSGSPYPAGGIGVAAGSVRGGQPLEHHPGRGRSEEYTSELQSRENLVCRLLL